MAALSPTRAPKYPRGSTLGCPCGYTGTVLQASAHISRGACHGATLHIVTDEEARDRAAAPPRLGVAVVPDRSLPPDRPPDPPPQPEPDPDPGDEDEDDEDDEGEEDEETVLAAIAAVDAPPPPPPSPAPRAAPRPVARLSDPWRPVQLSPEVHVRYRIACTDPGFRARFGSNFVGEVGDFVDQVVEAYFGEVLGYDLGLAPLAAPPGTPPPATVTLPRAALQELLRAQGLIVTEAPQNGRSAALPH